MLMKTLPDGYLSIGNEMINETMNTLYNLKMKMAKGLRIYYSDISSLLKFQ